MTGPAGTPGPGNDAPLAHPRGDATLVTDWRAQAALPAGSEHLMRVYDGAFPAESIGRFLAEGLGRGESVVVVARPGHRAALREVLGDGAGPPVFYLDADRAMARFIVDGSPDAGRFDETIGAVLNEAARHGNGRVRAYGEMVDLLCERGQGQAALDLERLWNEAARRRPLGLLCAYQRNALAGAPGVALAAEHAHVHGAGG